MHSDVDTIDRIKLIRSLRMGEIDIIVGINLLREGLDIPECGLVAILDADKEGYLRSKTSLVQTIGRAARNVDGKVILYADIKTKSIQAALEETEYRKQKQIEYNKINNITPQSVKRNIGEIIESIYEKDTYTVSLTKNEDLSPSKFEKHLQKLEKKMLSAAENLDFEKAAMYRDEIRKIKKIKWVLIDYSELYRNSFQFNYLIWSCNYAIKNSIAIAQKYKIRDIFVGIFIIAIGTSLPEFAATFQALQFKSEGIVAGNLIGSNIANILLVGGIMLFPISKLKILDQDKSTFLFFLIFSIFFFFLIIFDITIDIKLAIVFIFFINCFFLL